jgi:dienelactone hydrolase
MWKNSRRQLFFISGFFCGFCFIFSLVEAKEFGPVESQNYGSLSSYPQLDIQTKKKFLIKSTGRVNTYKMELNVQRTDVLENGDQQEQEFTVTFLYYKARGSVPRPVLIIPPNIEGVSILEKLSADYFARHGYSALVYFPSLKIQNDSYKVEQFNSLFTQALVELKSMVDWIEMNPEDFDAQRIGAFGFSLGGLYSSMLFGQDERIRSIVMFVAGGNLPNILSTSQNTFLKRLKKLTICRKGLKSEKDYEKLLEDSISIDPLRPSVRKQSEDILMWIAGKDTTVPTYNQFALWEKLERPLFKIFKNFGHIDTIATIPFQLKKVLSFFKKRFSSDLNLTLNQNEVVDHHLDHQIQNLR